MVVLAYYTAIDRKDTTAVYSGPDSFDVPPSYSYVLCVRKNDPNRQEGTCQGLGRQSVRS